MQMKFMYLQYTDSSNYQSLIAHDYIVPSIILVVANQLCQVFF